MNVLFRLRTVTQIRTALIMLDRLYVLAMLGTLETEISAEVRKLTSVM